VAINQPTKNTTMPRRHNYNRPAHLGGYNPENEAASRAEYLARKTTTVKQAEEEMEARLESQRAERQAEADARLQAKLEADAAHAAAASDCQAKADRDLAAQRKATRDLEVHNAARLAALKAATPKPASSTPASDTGQYERPYATPGRERREQLFFGLITLAGGILIIWIGMPKFGGFVGAFGLVMSIAAIIDAMKKD